MRALFDVNALLALFDASHTQHAKARQWWSANMATGWASTPLTQNGFLRIISRPPYPQHVRLADALAVLSAQIQRTDHEFWPDNLAIIDTTAFDHAHLAGPRQITDVYLLAMAVRHSGRLVTFDQSIPIAAVKNCLPSNLVVLT